MRRLWHNRKLAYFAYYYLADFDRGSVGFHSNSLSHRIPSSDWKRCPAAALSKRCSWDRCSTVCADRPISIQWLQFLYYKNLILVRCGSLYAWEETYHLELLLLVETIVIRLHWVRHISIWIYRWILSHRRSYKWHSYRTFVLMLFGHLFERLRWW